MSKVCLVIIFNHRFDQNIEILERIYKGRFSSIYYVVPFYDGDREDVITVYENSFRFHGYIAQAYEKIAGDYDHYFFVADDIAMNPKINEDNYTEWYHVDKDTSYITGRKPLGKMKGWGISQHFMDPFPVLNLYNGANWKDQIMSAEEAFSIAEQNGFKREEFEISTREVLGAIKYWKRYKRLITLLVKTILLGNEKLPYPIWGYYCDLFIIPSGIMKDFARMLGVFTGMNLYVEMAIPTAISLLSPKVSGDDEQDMLKPRLLWGAENRKTVIGEYGGDYSRLMKEWDDNVLYIHPIKLSQWDTKEI